MIIQEQIYEGLNRDMKNELTEFSVGLKRIRDDEEANKLYYKTVDGHIPVAADDMEKKKVMVIDDDRDIQMCISEYLKDAGYHVVCSESAEEAIESLVSGDFNVVISDIYMGDISGFEVISAARNAGIEQVVAMSGRGEAIRWEAQKYGATGFMHKPIKVDELLKTIDECA